MRIAQVTDFYLPRVGGIELHVANLARVQRRAGHHVDVITASGVIANDADQASSRIATGASFSRRAICAATRSALDGGYDVVHAHAGLATPLTFAVARAASRAGVPTVITVHSMIGRLAWLYRALDLATHWRALPVAWAAVSHAAAKPLRSLLGSEELVDVLPNAVDVDAWILDGRSPRDDHEIVIAAVMRLAARKRPIPLLRILQHARRETPAQMTLRVVIIGGGRWQETMQRFLQRHGMDSWVTLAGPQNHHEIRELFRRADLFVAPSRKESFGIAALEARSAGLPVLAMACSGVGEFLEPGRGGLLVADDRSMGEAIANFAANPAELAGISLHNRMVRPPFGWDAALRHTEVVYERARALQPTVGGAFATAVVRGWPAAETPTSLATQP